MAEIQKTTAGTGEMTQRFIEFVMMHGQNAALFLGQIPNPQTGKGEVNLDLAQMFIDQLVMIREKTRGNLTSEETTVLANTISNLQMLFFEASQPGSPPPAEKTAPPPSAEEASTPTAGAAQPERPAEGVAPALAAEGESKKKFTKSYGA